MLKKLFYASASILMLAFAYHLGATTAGAQAGSMVSGFSKAGTEAWVMTPNGDVYVRAMYGGGVPSGALYYVGNFWASPTPAGQPTFGQLKVQYRK